MIPLALAVTPLADRRPGILEEPSQRPTGDQAHLYDLIANDLPSTEAAPQDATSSN